MLRYKNERDKTAHIKIKKGGLRLNTMHTDISTDVKTKKLKTNKGTYKT